ncbi:Oidioi.mRNA.OKI2018_I69.chr2.g7102.t1.cds [Oikopleura dioica]|uniref:Oidioi.mRNA.OKI2018_I69.chr2.g7102.t1.cds n=1 Tax=Oikopleura dioica TaxID=34765 RepID=A0ABN7T532_OIKDI|nr:Oidioi.mRNA.OKI2018_I69.chr2.g7102.t1.cds [Oikopleura dioica]
MMFGGGVPENLISRAGDASGIEMGNGERLAIEGPPVSMVATTTDATSSVGDKTDRTGRARSAKSHDASRIRTGLPNIRSYPVQKNHPAECTDPIPVTHDDVDKGILNMIERGIIPPAAHIQLLPSPITKGHSTATKSAEEESNYAPSGYFHEQHPNIKVDPNFTMSSDDYSKI